MNKNRLLGCGLLCGAMLLFGAAPSARALSLDFISGGTLSSPIAEVWVHDRGASVIGSFDINVTFNPALLSPLGVTFGPYLGDLLQFEADAGSDLSGSDVVNAYEVSFLDASALSAIQPDRFLLYAIQFAPRGTGTSPLVFGNVTMSDELANPLSPQLNSASIDVQSSAVPEPGTFLLVGAGLAGMILWRRQRFP